MGSLGSKPSPDRAFFLSKVLKMTFLDELRNGISLKALCEALLEIIRALFTCLDPLHLEAFESRVLNVSFLDVGLKVVSKTVDSCSRKLLNPDRFSKGFSLLSLNPFSFEGGTFSVPSLFGALI